MQRDGFDRRLDLARRRAGLDAAEPAGAAADGEPHPLTFAFRLGAEMIGSLLVAGAIGWGLDHLFGTKPWIMIGSLPIGVAAGVMNLLRASSSGAARAGGGPRRGRGWGT